MKTVTVEQVQAGFPDLLRLIARGQELRVVRKRRPVAKIVPVTRRKSSVDWADTWSKVDTIFGGKPAPGKAGSRIIMQGRR